MPGVFFLLCSLTVEIRDLTLVANPGEGFRVSGSELGCGMQIERLNVWS